MCVPLTVFFLICTQKMTLSSDTLPPLLAQLADEIAAFESENQKFKVFEATIQDNSALFSPEEVQAVVSHGQRLEDSRQHKLDSLAVAMQVYEQKVLLIEEQLQKRKIILEQLDKETGILSGDKTLMEQFARGHAMLKREVEEARSSISVSEHSTR